MTGKGQRLYEDICEALHSSPGPSFWYMMGKVPALLEGIEKSRGLPRNLMKDPCPFFDHHDGLCPSQDLHEGHLFFLEP